MTANVDVRSFVRIRKRRQRLLTAFYDTPTTHPRHARLSKLIARAWNRQMELAGMTDEQLDQLLEDRQPTE